MNNITSHTELPPSVSVNELHLFGPTIALAGGRPVRLSAKGLALLTYLTLSGRPHHRETMANLFWPLGGGLGSLRVELTKLRQAGIELCPDRAPLLRSDLKTDLEDVRAAGGDEVWFGRLRGVPLGGIDEAMSPALTDWLREQREQLLAVAGHALEEVMGRAIYADDARQLALVRERAGRLGWTLSSGELTRPFHPTQHQARRLQQELERICDQATASPQVVLMVGRPGSGRRTTLHHALGTLPWKVVQVDAVANPNLLMTSLLMRLLGVLPVSLRPALHSLMAQSLPAEQALTALSALLLEAAEPLVIVLHDAETLSAELGPLVDFVLNWPLPLMLMLVTTEAREEVVTRSLSRHLRPERFTVLRQLPLSAGDLLPPGVTAPGPAAERHLFQVIRQSEGWLTAALPLLGATLPLPPRSAQTSTVRGVLIGEAYQAVGNHAALLAPLAALPAPFSMEQALETVQVTVPRTDAQDVIERALHSGVLERVPEVVELTLSESPSVPPAFGVPDGDHPLAFVSELQRAALAGTLESAHRARLRRTLSSPAPAGLTWAGLPLETSAAGERSALPTASSLPPLGLPGGYRVFLASQELHPFGALPVPQLSVLRLGARGHHPPELRLHLPGRPGTRRWAFQVRCDMMTCDPEGLPLWVEDKRGLVPLSLGPEGQWVQASGHLPWPGAPLTLRIQARDLVLHLARFVLDAAEEDSLGAE